MLDSPIAAYLYVTILSPALPPTIFNNIVVIVIFTAVAYDNNSMIELSRGVNIFITFIDPSTIRLKIKFDLDCNCNWTNAMNCNK